MGSILGRPTYLFLDTEWADEAGAEVASIALISESGLQVRYAERGSLAETATEFLRQHVHPHLDRSAAAMPVRRRGQPP